MFLKWKPHLWHEGWWVMFIVLAKLLSIVTCKNVWCKSCKILLTCNQSSKSPPRFLQVQSLLNRLLLVLNFQSHVASINLHAQYTIKCILQTFCISEIFQFVCRSNKSNLGDIIVPVLMKFSLCHSLLYILSFVSCHYLWPQSLLEWRGMFRQREFLSGLLLSVPRVLSGPYLQLA